MYVVVVVEEDDNEDDEGGNRGHGKDGDNARDHHSNRWGGTSVNAGRGAGGGAAGYALLCGLIGVDDERGCQAGAARPLNASETSSASATSSPSLSTAQTSTWTLTQTLSQRCDAPPL